MVPYTYKSIEGYEKEFDLDSVFDLVSGYSKIEDGWSSLIIYIPNKRTFVELRDSPQDYRGNSKSEADEVTKKYIMKTFGITENQLIDFEKNPKAWELSTKKVTPNITLVRDREQLWRF